MTRRPVRRMYKTSILAFAVAFLLAVVAHTSGEGDWFFLAIVAYLAGLLGFFAAVTHDDGGKW